MADGRKQPFPLKGSQIRSSIKSCVTVKLCYCARVKNITISLDDDLYRKARIKAAERDTSVSALVKNHLLRLIAGTDETGQSEFDRRLAQEQVLRTRLFAAGKGLRSTDNLSREELHDRDALR